MKSQKGYVINVIVTGFMVVVVLSTVLFVGRFFCVQGLLSLMPSRMLQTAKSPSGLLGDWDKKPDGYVAEPNALVVPSRIQSGTRNAPIAQSFGIFQHLEKINQVRSDQLVSPYIHTIVGRRYTKEPWYLDYFDEGLGLFVRCSLNQQGQDRDGKWSKIIESYAGPKGISNKLDTTIGRFNNLLISPGGIVFDRQLSKFFRIDFYNREVKAGPKIEQEIMQVGRLEKNDGAMQETQWQPPMQKIVKQKKRPDGKVRPYTRNQPVAGYDDAGVQWDAELVLDKSGSIYKLDPDTLEITGSLGRLPWPRIHGLLAYEVSAISIQDEYKGLVTSGIGPDIFAPELLVFDDAGKHIGEGSRVGKLSGFGGGPALSVANFVLETLHPTIFQAAAYFTSLRFDGAQGPKSLFILPNSLVGRKGAQLSTEDLVEYILGLWVILPSLVISVILAQRVEKDARAIGISPQAKFWWLVTTLAFGLAAYITYRLTRPRLVLVTCDNCGRARRPDMQRCHECDSKWHVPDLIAPLWRVIEKHQSGETDQTAG
ncbi:MAG: hypothetical protein ACYTFK_02010 [Planctomycetota bacterium]|jgi:hypothetical protein